MNWPTRATITEEAIDVLIDVLEDDLRHKNATREFMAKWELLRARVAAVGDFEDLVFELDSLANERVYTAARAVAREWLANQGYAAVDKVMSRGEP